MSDKIPITFEYHGQRYKGEFSSVSGSGSTAKFHLMINNRFYGQLLLTENYGWQFHNNKDQFKDLAEYFGDYIVAWVQ